MAVAVPPPVVAATVADVAPANTRPRSRISVNVPSVTVLAVTYTRAAPPSATVRYSGFAPSSSSAPAPAPSSSRTFAVAAASPSMS